jgi:hypothetical protein
MIALIIIPLKWADPNSHKVLIPDESRPSERFAGEGGEGFYSVRQALAVHFPNDYSWRYNPNLASYVAAGDLLLYAVAGVDNYYAGVYIEDFSAPSDYDNHFVETPLIAVPVHPSPQQTLRGAE